MAGAESQNEVGVFLSIFIFIFIFVVIIIIIIIIIISWYRKSALLRTLIGSRAVCRSRA